MLKEWDKGDHITLDGQPQLLGRQARWPPTVDLQWSDEAAQRLAGPPGGHASTASTTSAPDDFATVQADSNLKLFPREA